MFVKKFNRRFNQNFRSQEDCVTVYQTANLRWATMFYDRNKVSCSERFEDYQNEHFQSARPARERSVHVYVTKNVKRGRNLDSPVSSMAVSVEEWKAGEENFRTETAPRLDRRRWKRQIAPRQECHMYFRKSRRSKSGYAKVHLEGTN